MHAHIIATISIPYRYEFITQCWTESPDKRPSFQDLSQQLNSLLEGVAGYMDFSAFSSDLVCGAEGYDHLEKKRLGIDHPEEKA